MQSSEKTSLTLAAPCPNAWPSGVRGRASQRLASRDRSARKREREHSTSSNQSKPSAFNAACTPLSASMRRLNAARCA
ncbi:hypothetical protein [Lysobacter gummosus]|uniref:hypothetical protein n=1 Tax=Lysobacter gummosus TaxID=262324 RepID=UPI0036259540